MPKRKKTTTKTVTAKDDGLTSLFNKVERETEKVYNQIVCRTEQSSRELRKNIKTVVGKLRKNDWVVLANDTRCGVEKEFKKLTGDLMSKVYNLEILPWENLSRDKIVREAKKNLETLTDEISGYLNAGEIANVAKQRADEAKKRVFSILSIPTKSDITNLGKKIQNLEKRVNAL